jgi:hypothetical protein
MATGDILGILRGLISPPSKHEQLARTLLGVALGTLAIDSLLPDERIMKACKMAVERCDMSLSTMYRELPADVRGDTAHQDLAYKVIRMAAQELPPKDFLATCTRMLQQIRIAAADDAVMQKLKDAQSAAVEAKPKQ